MMRRPTQKKEPKKFGQKQHESISKLPKKNIKIPQQQKAPLRTQSIPEKVQKLEKNIERLQENALKPELQELLIQEIKGIKSELKEIKYHIGMNGASEPPRRSVQGEEEQYQQEENIMNFQNREPPNSIPYQKEQIVTEHHQIPSNNPERNQPRRVQQLYRREKQMLDIGRIQPYMKDFKMQGSRGLMPQYQGYHKKSSKAVIIKYCNENQSMDPIFNLYERLWKNIVKAKTICINKVYDINEPLAGHILVLQANKLSLQQIQLPLNIILPTILRAIQFFHDCGYLYRNMHPDHIMQSFQDNLVLIDLKNMRKFVDIKGRFMKVSSTPSQHINEFTSNARLRGVNEGRKDDLQCLGYLALYILQGCLPWNIKNMIEVRSKLTLKQLYGKYENLLQFMIIISQMSSQDTPNYDQLFEILRNTSF